MNLANYFSACTILAALTLSLPARADIPPADVCSASALGQPCNNATSDGSSLQPGVCKSATCSRSTPDGPITYACFRCEVAEQGVGGQPNAAGAGGSGDSDVGGSSTAGAPTHSPGGTSAGGTPSSSAGSGTTGAKAGSSAVASDPKTPDRGGGCSVAQARGSAGLAAALAALGLLVAGLRRRRSLTG